MKKHKKLILIIIILLVLLTGVIIFLNYYLFSPINKLDLKIKSYDNSNVILTVSDMEIDNTTYLKVIKKDKQYILLITWIGLEGKEEIIRSYKLTNKEYETLIKDIDSVKHFDFPPKNYGYNWVHIDNQDDFYIKNNSYKNCYKIKNKCY